MKRGKEKECKRSDTETDELLAYLSEQDNISDAPAATSDAPAATFAALQSKARHEVHDTFRWVFSGLEDTCSDAHQVQPIRFYNEKTPNPGGKEDPKWSSASSPANAGGRYFTAMTPKGRKTDIATVITLYNEECDEAERTLESLAKQDLAQGTNHAIVLICDGIEKMSLSMKQYLVSLFPNPQLEDLFTVHSDRLFRVMTASPPKSGELPSMHYQLKKELASVIPPADAEEMRWHLTFVVQNLSQDGAQRLPTMVNIAKTGQAHGMDISLIIKLDNRFKHNSHEWGFCAFAEDLEAEMVFASDVGTLYAKSCLRRLKHYLDKHDDVSAVTGRQRVMTPKQQGCEDERWYSLDRWFRNAQCYDYESSFASFMAAFHMAGMLPVIPGPCGLYRRQDMTGKDGPWDWYFETVHTPPERQDITMGNLLLAEDPETELKTLAYQRRRWINGTVAGYLYLGLGHPELIFNSKHSLIGKWFIWLLIMCQVLMFAVVAVSPALFLIMLILSLDIISSTLDADSDAYLVGLVAIAVGTYLWFTIAHHIYSRFIAFLFYILMYIYAATVVLSVVAASITLWETDFTEMSDFYETKGPLLIAIVSAVLPVLISILTGGKSFFLMLRCFVHYYLFLPTMVSIFGAYSFSRSFDLSWGNRPQSQITADSAGAHEDELNKAKEKLKEQSQTSFGCVVLANVLLMLVVLMSRHVALFFLLMGAVVFLWSGIQMVLSFVWYFYWSIRTGTNWLWNGAKAMLCRCCRGNEGKTPEPPSSHGGHKADATTWRGSSIYVSPQESV